VISWEVQRSIGKYQRLSALAILRHHRGGWRPSPRKECNTPTERTEDRARRNNLSEGFFNGDSSEKKDKKIMDPREKKNLRQKLGEAETVSEAGRTKARMPSGIGLPLYEKEKKQVESVPLSIERTSASKNVK